MARANQLIVPRWFTAADAQGPFVRERFQRVTARQVRALAQAGMVRQLGPRLWQLAEELGALPPVFETGDGLLSLELGRMLRNVIRSEMGRRPIAEPPEVS